MKKRDGINIIFISVTILLVVFFASADINSFTQENEAFVFVDLNNTETNVLNWPDQRSFKVDLDNIYHESYIYLELSKQDNYVLEFLNSQNNHSHKLVINTGEWAWFYLSEDIKPIQHLIPLYIVEDGYDSIIITVMSGDAIYSVQNIQLANSIMTFDYFVNTIDFEVKQIEIVIDENDFDKIEEKRLEAIKLGILIAEDGDEVGATFISEGEKTEGTLRLKGDWIDHLVGDKWSFRIDLKSDNAIYGMSEFSVQSPDTRVGIREAVLYEYYRSEGGVALRYDFADVWVNGIYKGVYAVEEFFTSEMIEASDKRDGPIIKQNEDDLWASRAYDVNDEVSANVETFKYNNSIEDEYNLDLSEFAINLYLEYMQHTVSMDEAFDIELQAKYHAIEDIFIALHGSRVWHNTRYYLNPLTLKLEPIPYDELSNEYEYVEAEIGFPWLSWNVEYYDLYMHYLLEYTTKIPDFLDENSQWIDNMSLMLMRDGSNVHNLDFIDQRVEFIKEYLSELGVDVNP